MIALTIMRLKTTVQAISAAMGMRNGPLLPSFVSVCVDSGPGGRVATMGATVVVVSMANRVEASLATIGKLEKPPPGSMGSTPEPEKETGPRSVAVATVASETRTLTGLTELEVTTGSL